MPRDGGEPGPEIEVIDLDSPAGPATRVSVGGGGGPRRGLAGLAIGAVVIIVALAAVSSGENRRDVRSSEEDATTTTSTEAERTSTSRRRATTTTIPSVGPVIPEAAGSVLVMLGDRQQVAVDLATGERTELHVGDAYAAVPVEGGLVSVSGGNAVFVALPSGDESSLGPADHAVPTERSDRVWLIEGDDTGLALSARLVDAAGNDLADPVSLPRNGWVGHATTRYLIFETEVRTYRVDVGGAVAPLDGVSPIAALDPDRMLAIVCDSGARCGAGVVDLDTREVRLAVPADNTLAGHLRGEPAVFDEESRLAAFVRYPGVGPEVVVVRPDGAVLDRLSYLIGSGLAWLPGGTTLLLTRGDGALVRWDPGSHQEPAALNDVPDVDAHSIYVVSSSPDP